MAVARKSEVSRQDSWFQTAIHRGRKPRSAYQRKSFKSTGTTFRTSIPQSPGRQRGGVNNLSVPTKQFTKVNAATPRITTEPAAVEQQAASTVSQMPGVGEMPSWLLRLYKVHRHSSLAAFLLVATVLSVYGFTVYSQQLWSQAYRKLQNLQRYERQLATTNAILKNKIVQEAARKPSGLVSPTPESMIFLRPAPENPNFKSSTTIPDSEIPQPTTEPVAY